MSNIDSIELVPIYSKTLTAVASLGLATNYYKQPANIIVNCFTTTCADVMIQQNNRSELTGLHVNH